VGIVAPISVIDTVLESLAVVVAEMETGVILFASKPAETMFGFKVRGEMVGRPVEDLMPERLRSLHPGYRAAYDRDPHIRQPGGSGMSLIGLRADDRSEFPVESILIPGVVEGKRCAIAVILDMTARKILKAPVAVDVSVRPTSSP
jgi:PAS domain S-box-containing protein